MNTFRCPLPRKTARPQPIKHKATTQEESAALRQSAPFRFDCGIGRLRSDRDQADARVEPSQIEGIARDDRKA
jgi:hypothetical protein